MNTAQPKARWLRPFSSVLLLILAATPTAARAQQLDAERIHQLTRQNSARALTLYREFLALPNDANYPDDILRLVDWMEAQFQQRGLAKL